MTSRVRTVEAALTLHEEHHAYVLRVGRCLALRIVETSPELGGEIHTRLVRDALVARGDLAQVPPTSGVAEERWFGNLFLCCRPQIWENTGKVNKVFDPGRNIHRGRGNAVWRLRDGVTTAERAAFAELPPAPANLAAMLAAGASRPGPPALAAPPPPLPFDGQAVLEWLRHLRRLSTLNGDRPSEDFDKLVAWLEAQGPGGRP